MIVDVPAEPAFTVTVVGLAVMVKSWTVKVTVVWAVVLPLVPVTVTVYPLALPLHDSVDEPLVPVTLAGFRLHVSPVVGETVAARLVVPPAELLTLIVEVPVAPAKIVALVGVAVRARPEVTLNVTVTEWEIDPLVPRIVTVYMLAVVEFRVRVDVAVPPLSSVTLARLRDIVGPEGETLAERLTVPARLLRLEIVMVEVPRVPLCVLMLVGLAVMVKPGG